MDNIPCKGLERDFLFEKQCNCWSVYLGSVRGRWIGIAGRLVFECFSVNPHCFNERNISIFMPMDESFLNRLNPIENVHFIDSAHGEDGWTKLSDRTGGTRFNYFI
jgi:hypothetical protein